MTYTFDQLKEDVRKEAEALRQKATPEELSRLNFNCLDPHHLNKCIYGQMTGHCNSVRGVQLIESCAIRYIKDGDLTYVARDGFKRIQERVNGATVSDLYYDRNSLLDVHYSAIEAYILLPEARNENLIAYLKGETDKLEL
jgi:hypothetical protein